MAPLNGGPSPGLIINADDLGFSEAVNQAIDTALVKGWITSSTLIANAPYCHEGAAIAHRHQARASFGIHLNLTEFHTLSDPAAFQSAGLLAEDGSFAGTIRRFRGGRELTRACHRELDAQIRLACSLGLQISHLDSHHHIHTIPWLLPVIHRLQKEHGIWRMRNTMNVYGRTLHRRPPLPRVFAKKIWQAACRLRGSRMPDVFTGMDVFVEDPLRKEFRTCASIELMCHPGQDGYEQELSLLRKCHSLLGEGAFGLCTFRDLRSG